MKSLEEVLGFDGDYVIVPDEKIPGFVRIFKAGDDVEKLIEEMDYRDIFGDDEDPDEDEEA